MLILKKKIIPLDKHNMLCYYIFVGTIPEGVKNALRALNVVFVIISNGCAML